MTDGSASWQTRHGGWAWIALDAFDGLEQDSGFAVNATNNQMELVAPTNGLVELAIKYGPCDVLVYSDSEYVVKGAMNKSRARTKNVKFWKRLERAMKAHTYVEFIHIRGHSGHFWNEAADQLAGAARLKGAK